MQQKAFIKAYGGVPNIYIRRCCHWIGIESKECQIHEKREICSIMQLTAMRELQNAIHIVAGTKYTPGVVLKCVPDKFGEQKFVVPYTLTV